MNVPADHIVASTGSGKNFSEVLTMNNLQDGKSKNTKEPIEIVTLDEAKKAENLNQKQKNLDFRSRKCKRFHGLLLENSFGTQCLN